MGERASDLNWDGREKPECKCRSGSAALWVMESQLFVTTVGFTTSSSDRLRVVPVPFVPCRVRGLEAAVAEPEFGLGEEHLAPLHRHGATSREAHLRG